MRDPESGVSKRYGFVSFDNFDSSDEAIKKMNGQYISGKPIEVTYALKKDTKGEKHGSVAERILAANRPINLMGSVESTTGQGMPMTAFPSMMNPNFNINPPLPTNMQGNSNYMQGVPGIPSNMPNMPNMPKIPMMPPMNFNMPMMGHMNIRPPMMPPTNK